MVIAAGSSSTRSLISEMHCSYIGNSTPVSQWHVAYYEFDTTGISFTGEEIKTNHFVLLYSRVV